MQWDERRHGSMPPVTRAAVCIRACAGDVAEFRGRLGRPRNPAPPIRSTRKCASKSLRVRIRARFNARSDAFY